MNMVGTYDSIRYMQRRHRTDTIVRSNKIESLLHKGDNFNVVQLEAERQNPYIVGIASGYEEALEMVRFSVSLERPP